MLLGRKTIYTDVETITYENIFSVLRQAQITHNYNADRINFLMNYDRGEQPLKRVKNYRKDIDIHVVDNVAHEISTFWIGYGWSNPITLVQRGEIDSNNDNEANAISLLNECYSALGIKKKTIELADTVVKTCRGYTYVDINMDYEEGDSYFTVDVLDPRHTFVVYSSRYTDHRPILGVTFRKSEDGKVFYTCFTKDTRFEIVNEEIVNGEEVDDRDKWYHAKRSGEVNPLGMIPIVEWFKSYDGLGIFEHCIDDMDALNILESDICNATDETVQAIWHTNDVEFPVDILTDDEGNKVEVTRKPKEGDWIQTYTSEGGRQPFITPLKSAFDYDGNVNYVINKRELILQKCNVPQRSSTSGGSSGVAMDSANGWASAEVEASMQQEIMEDCKMQEVKLVLKAISLSPFVEEDNPLLKLKAKDVKPSIKRQKSYELNNKVNALATLLSHGIYGSHAIKTINLFDDENQVWADSEELITKYQKSLFEKETTSSDGDVADTENRLTPDLSDQTENTPLLDKNRV